MPSEKLEPQGQESGEDRLGNQPLVLGSPEEIRTRAMKLGQELREVTAQV